jgi:sugar lactone lactonase YvrE
MLAAMARAARRRIIARGAAALLVVLLAYLLLWPTKVEPVAWPSEPTTALDGPFAPNDALTSGVAIVLGEGPEDMAVGPDRRFYTGMHDGRILRMQPDGTAIEGFAQTGGRPLGLAFDRGGDLWVADARRGVLRIDPAGAITVAVDEVDGTPVRFADELAIAKDGTVWISEASRRWDVDGTVLDVLEGQATGRLLRHDPARDQTEVALDGLRFANGVVLAPDESYVLVAETFAYRVARLWLTGPRAGSHDLLIDHLPGFCDNLDLDADGTLWIALPSRRSALVDASMPYPFVRRALARIPTALQPIPPPYGFVVGVGLDGAVRFNLQDPRGRVHAITSATPVADELVLGTLHGDALFRVPRPRFDQRPK